MINPQELRIGNWVKAKSINIQVEGVHCNGINPKWCLDGLRLDYTLDELQPIQLTHDLLIKIGFTLIKVQDFYAYQLQNKFTLCMWMGDTPVQGFEKKGMCYAGEQMTEIPSLHYLQNYYYFVNNGNELPIQSL